MENIEEAYLVLDWLGALKMQHDCGVARRLGGADLGDGADDADPLLARAVNLEPFRHDLHGRAEILKRTRGGKHRSDPSLDNVGQPLVEPARLDERCRCVEQDGRRISLRDMTVHSPSMRRPAPSPSSAPCSQG